MTERHPDTCRCVACRVGPAEPPARQMRRILRRENATLRAAATKAAKALANSAVPLEAFEITERERPYAEHSPAIKRSIGKACESIREALSALQAAGIETEEGT